MNYLEQIIAFQRWKEVNPLPASAIVLWYELMAACNKAGWPEDFTIQNAMLQAIAGLSRKEFERARQMLIDLGRIHYSKSKRVNTAGKYEIIPFSIVQKGQQKVQQEGQREEKREEHGRGIEKGNSLKDLNKPKPNETKQGNKPPVSPKGEPIDKIQYADFVFLTKEEYGKITELLGEEERDRFFLEYASWISGQPPRVQKTRSAYLTILNWFRREQSKPKPQYGRQQQSQYQRTKSKLDQMYQEAMQFEQSGSY